MVVRVATTGYAHRTEMGVVERSSPHHHTDLQHRDDQENMAQEIQFLAEVALQDVGGMLARPRLQGFGGDKI